MNTMCMIFNTTRERQRDRDRDGERNKEKREKCDFLDYVKKKRKSSILKDKDKDKRN